MGQYAEQLAGSELYRQFDLLTGHERIARTDVDHLKGLAAGVADAIGPHLDCIRQTFLQYTEHDLRHLANVADLVYRFLPKQPSEDPRAPQLIRLNALELALLWLGILLHDVGMYVSPEEREQTLGSAPYKEYLGHHADRVRAAEASRRTGQERRARAIDDALLAEFFRRCHPERARAYIDTPLSQSVRLVFREVPLADDVARLCESHGWGVRESNNPRDLKQAVIHLDRDRRVMSFRANLQYLACCLRLGDVLDFDRSRTPLAVYEQTDFTESQSIEEWNKHLSIDGWDVDEHRVMYDARCAHPAYYVAVHEFLDRVDRELSECRFLLDAAPGADAEKYALWLAHVVDRHQVRMRDPRYVAGGFRFRLEYEEILRLLMDKSLYPSPTLFLRELLQNALDACRYQEALAREKGMADKYRPRITVWDHSEDAADPRIVFADNGIGMSQQVVESHFLRVGRSFYRSPEFEAEKARLASQGIQLDACSLFGIGFLSCFLAGDTIEVETFRLGSAPLRITITGPSKYFLIERLPQPEGLIPYKSPEDESLDRPPHYPGTRVTVHLRPGWHTPEKPPKNGIVHETLDTFAVNQEYDLRIIRPGQDAPYVIPRLRWEREPPEPPVLLPELPYADVHSLLRSVTEDFRGLMAPSRVPFERWEISRSLKGAAWIWLLSDGKGGLTPARGELRVLGDKLAVHSQILDHVARFNDLVGLSVARDTLLDELLRHCGADPDARELPRRAEAICGTPLFEDVERPNIADWAASFATLGIAERTEICSALRTDTRLRYSFLRDVHREWWAVARVPTLLALGDRKALYDITRHCDTSIEDRVNIAGTWEVGLFGIRIPGGIVAWDPERGHAERIRFLPYVVSARIDCHLGEASLLSANRLFVPKEKAGSLVLPLGRAILRHACELANEHPHDPAWREWFTEFMDRCSPRHESILAELERLDQFIYVECHIDGQRAVLKPSEVVARFGRFVRMLPWGRQTESEGVEPGNWFVKRFPHRTRKDGVEEVDLQGVIDALKGSYES